MYFYSKIVNSNLSSSMSIGLDQLCQFHFRYLDIRNVYLKKSCQVTDFYSSKFHNISPLERGS